MKHTHETASSGDRSSAASSGSASAAVVTGHDGTVTCGPYGALVLAWWHQANQRAELRCARVGCGDGSDGLLKAYPVRYRLTAAGEFVEVGA